jgi:hypothetical protein
MMTAYGDDANTINMVIVDAAMRGRALGRKLMEDALAKAGEPICYLTATQEGLPLYEKLGFVATGEVVHHQGEAPLVEAPNRSALIRLLRERAKFTVMLEEGDVQAFAAIRPFGPGLDHRPGGGEKRRRSQGLDRFLLAHHRSMFVRVDTDTSTNLAEWLTGRGLALVSAGITMRRP